jgi:TRAP-type C4-dicarboxylate transport system substrate-binding protein
MEDAAEKAKATLKERGMTIVEDVDKDAFRKAGQKAYEVLNLVEAKAKVHKEIGK